MEEVHILHTNDLHSHLEQWPKIRRFLNDQKKELARKDIESLAVDLGDFSDRVHPLTEATDGKANVQLMNQVSYDGVTIGNNEGVGNSHEKLDELYEEANFDVLLANVKNRKEESQPSWAKPYKIIQTKKGTRIALLGLTAPFTLTYHPNGWSIYEADECLPALIEELSDKADILVLLSHLGIQEEKRIAKDYPDIQIILGSHTHHLFVEGCRVHHSLLAAAGKFGQYIGEVTLLFDNHVLIHSEATVHPTEILPEQMDDKMEINGYIERGHQLLQTQVVGEIPFELTNTSFLKETSMTSFALEAAKEYAHTKAAVLNSGLFLENIPAGYVNNDQLHQAIPHPMHLINVTLSGTEFIRLIYEMEKNRNFLRHFPVIGMGFRGKIFGEIVYSGVNYEQETQHVTYLGEEIEAEKKYTITMVDHFLFVPFFPTIEIAGDIEMLFPEFLRNVVGKYIHHHYPCEKNSDTNN